MFFKIGLKLVFKKNAQCAHNVLIFVESLFKNWMPILCICLCDKLAYKLLFLIKNQQVQ